MFCLTVEETIIKLYFSRIHSKMKNADFILKWNWKNVHVCGKAAGWWTGLLPTTASFMLASTLRGSPQEQIWTQLIGSQIQAGRRPVAYHYLFHAGEAACYLPLPLSCWRGGLLPTTTSFIRDSPQGEEIWTELIRNQTSLHSNTDKGTL